MKLNTLKVTSSRIAHLGLALAIFAGPAWAQPAHYKVIDLGPVGGPPGSPYVISNDGLVVGADTTSGTSKAVLWLGGLKLNIGKPGLGGKNSAAFGVNEFAHVVGQADTWIPNSEDFCGFKFFGLSSSTSCRPFFWRDGFMATLLTLGGENGYAYMINNRDQVVGLAETPEKDPTPDCPVHQFKPVMWENGVPHELPTYPGDSDGVAAWINDNGEAAGASGVCTALNPNDGLYLYENHALVWKNGKATDLGNLGPNGIPGAGNHACAINNQGQAVGHTTSDVSTVAFLWTRKTGMQNLGTLSGDFASFALGINDGGKVVGLSISPAFSFRAFLWENGAMTDLNTLVTANPSSLYLIQATNINSSGEIAGVAVDGTGMPHGFLAIPTRKSKHN